jgi:alkanesulfonate monooxygenase SsuD/methylene tetrahydromethanopterin reductase-like flavin-dependent oxidoreductase (luciferase family)
MWAESYWGVWLHADRPLSTLMELAQAAEARGAAAILVADEGTDRDLFVTLAALAQHTSRALLFGAVTNPHTRHPVVTAAAFASLAELAPGRIVAGFGAGGSRVFEPMVLQPRRPFSALRECVEVVDALLRGEAVEHRGEFSVHARLPWSGGALPIAIAGRGPRVERLAATRADWVLLAGRPIAAVAVLVPRLRALGVTNRGRMASIAWNPNVAWTEPMRDEVRAHLSYMLVDMPEGERVAPEVVLERFAVTGSRAEVVQRLDRLRRSVTPELFAFDAYDYSVAFVHELADVVAEAGILSKGAQ